MRKSLYLLYLTEPLFYIFSVIQRMDFKDRFLSGITVGESGDYIQDFIEFKDLFRDSLR